ncbi:MAG: neutral/alkaline non-lysosomal ceramidase N-terminal domain-containing protein [Planctomycetota bacterium]|nr:neutral/alkaline non-lysosomal ceramidase N-terminal domain-containing protein [Planctomycetota bacterium]
MSIRITFLVTMMLGVTGNLIAEEGRQFKAGAAAANITPPLGSSIIGGFRPIPATHIHDDLFARCIVLDDGSTQLALVIADVLGIPREIADSAKAQITKHTKIPASHILIAATHTHSAATPRGPKGVFWPDEISAYGHFLAQRISDGVRRAVNNLEPAQIGWGVTEEPREVFNRRWYAQDAGILANPFGGVDRVRMNPPRNHPSLDTPAGPTDPEIRFLSIQATSGRPIALLANYSLHYVGGVNSGDISADYFGYFSRYIAQKIQATEVEPKFVGVLSNGTSGDINNINFQPEPGTKRYAPYEKMREVAHNVATKVEEAYANVQYKDWVKLGALQKDIKLKLRQPTEAMLRHFEEALKLPEGKFISHSTEKIYAARIANLKDGPDSILASLQTLRIGNTGIAAIPFETFVEIGLHLKAQSPFENSFTVELANGWYGYLPTPEQHRLGGYETWLGTNWVELNASNRITTELLKMFDELHKDE